MSTPRPTVRDLYRDPNVRNYLFAGLAALAMVFVVLFQEGSDLGGLLVVVLGVAGMALRWTPAPPVVLLVLTYFLVFPLGIPEPGYGSTLVITAGRFRVVDLMLVVAVVVYLACQYRLLGILQQAVPDETRPPVKGDRPFRRPLAAVRPGEVARVMYLTGAVVVAGQLVWLVLTGVEIELGRPFPFRLAGRREWWPQTDGPGVLSAPATRFVLLLGLVFFTTVLARLVFGYWGLRVMGRAEAGMVLQDVGWDETRRERQRVEGWRWWGRRRATARRKPGPPGGTV